MRVCHIVEATGGGVGRIVAPMVAHLADQGHDVTIIYSPVRADSLFLKGLLGLDNVRVIRLDMQRAVGLHDFVAGWRLYKLLKQRGPFDVIHSHSSKAGGLARIVGMFVAGRQIYHPHGFVTMAPKASAVYGVMERILSWFSDAIIVVSQQERNHAIKRLHIAEHKLKTIYNGIDIGFVADAQKAKQILNFPDGSFVIGIVGRLTELKRHDRALDAFALVAGQYHNAQLAIVGDGELRDAIHNQVKKLNLENRVKYFEGYDARELMPAFDVLLCSSDKEAFPLIFPESLHAGVPIVTTRIGGADETAIEGNTGFIADDFAPTALAQALQKILDMPEADRFLMKAQCKDHAQQFSTDNMYNNVEVLYVAQVGRGQS